MIPTGLEWCWVSLGRIDPFDVDVVCISGSGFTLAGAEDTTTKNKTAS